MTNEYKNKILFKYIISRKWETCDVFGCEYWGTVISRSRDSSKILILWQDEYQILTITKMFHGALTQTFYKDTAQVGDLIRILNSYRRNR